jgi:hypothetical protein
VASASSDIYHNTVPSIVVYAVGSCYCDTAGIREMYQYIQTIDITSIYFVIGSISR